MPHPVITALLQRTAWLLVQPLFALFCSFTVTGVENLRLAKGNVLLASNHASELDPILIAAALPFFSRHLPLFYFSREKDFYQGMGRRRHLYGGRFFALWGAFAVKVGLRNYKESLETHLSLAREGRTLCIFPSGTWDHNPSRAKGGVAYLAHEAGIPIIPVSVRGTEHMGIADFLLRRRRVRVSFGKPLTPDELFVAAGMPVIAPGRDDYQTAAAAVMARVAALR